uniref:Putative quinoprotein alcohol dehydrogenase-like superfamily n=1 Tax=Helianthus annuus TaxID=4232 RepID=A0A251UV12_HELAN
MKWKLSRTEFGEIATLSFTNKGRKLCAISTDGTLCEMNSETGEILKEITIPKKYILLWHIYSVSVQNILVSVTS